MLIGRAGGRCTQLPPFQCDGGREGGGGRLRRLSGWQGTFAKEKSGETKAGEASERKIRVIPAHSHTAC